MLKVIWGEIAKESYFNELERINIYHTNREVENFINLVDEVIFNLRTKVLLGKVSKKKKLTLL